MIRVKEERPAFRFAGKFWIQHRFKGLQNVHWAISQRSPDHAPPHLFLTFCLKAIGPEVVTQGCTSQAGASASRRQLPLFVQMGALLSQLPLPWPGEMCSFGDNSYNWEINLYFHKWKQNLGYCSLLAARELIKTVNPLFMPQNKESSIEDQIESITTKSGSTWSEESRILYCPYCF